MCWTGHTFAHFFGHLNIHQNNIRWNSESKNPKRSTGWSSRSMMWGPGHGTCRNDLQWPSDHLIIWNRKWQWQSLWILGPHWHISTNELLGIRSGKNLRSIFRDIAGNINTNGLGGMFHCHNCRYQLFFDDEMMNGNDFTWFYQWSFTILFIWFDD